MTERKYITYPVVLFLLLFLVLSLTAYSGYYIGQHTAQAELQQCEQARLELGDTLWHTMNALNYELSQ